MIFDTNMSEQERIHAIKEQKRATKYAFELSCAHDSGVEEGIKKGIEKSILSLHSNGFTPEDIAKGLSLDINYVNKILNK